MTNLLIYSGDFFGETSQLKATSPASEGANISTTDFGDIAESSFH